MSESKSESKEVARLVTVEEREQAVKLLTAAFAEDTSPVDEFEKRVAEVYKAESSTALQAITRDLPVTSAGNTNVPAPVDQPTAIQRRSEQQLRCVLSSMERRLHDPMPERLDVRSVVGSVELDLRRAEFPPGVTEIHIDAILANVEIELPDHVEVEDAGNALLGHFSVRGRRRRRDRDDPPTPVVRITGRSILSNVEIELDD